MSVLQSDFTNAILDPALAVPKGLSDPQGRPAGRRFSVYRNNVAVGLTEALEAAFPVIHTLVGAEFFHAMAGVYLRKHPPSKPMMMFYGARMPGFLEDFEPVSHLGYLPDVARLELAFRQSYHAADSQPIDPASLQELPMDQLMQARLVFAPALRLVASQWPILSIWKANTQQNSAAPQMQPEAVLITRPEFDPAPVALGPGGKKFLEELAKGRTFGAALGVAGRDFDLSEMLGDLFKGRAITKIETGDNS